MRDIARDRAYAIPQFPNSRHVDFYRSSFTVVFFSFSFPIFHFLAYYVAFNIFYFSLRQCLPENLNKFANCFTYTMANKLFLVYIGNINVAISLYFRQRHGSQATSTRLRDAKEERNYTNLKRFPRTDIRAP